MYYDFDEFDEENISDIKSIADFQRIVEWCVTLALTHPTNRAIASPAQPLPYNLNKY
jgi:hypothetical protein